MTAGLRAYPVCNTSTMRSTTSMCRPEKFYYRSDNAIVSSCVGLQSTEIQLSGVLGVVLNCYARAVGIEIILRDSTIMALVRSQLCLAINIDKLSDPRTLQVMFGAFTYKGILHQRAQKATIESKSSMLRLFASRFSLVISFLKRDATLKAMEAFDVLPVAAKSLPLKKVVRAISFLCASGSTDQISSALLVINLEIVRIVPWMNPTPAHLHRIFALAQANHVLRHLVIDICSVEISFSHSCAHVA